ncbi:hypothetical protein SAMN05216330_104786 [Bradyrhizobium sp. Ghvi]|uniref:PIN domain-containing protein n=1 Tax=Bradyrhizobium sp. Ghvi TaxID=1855319 RepID=UPI0008E24A97|nr:PIN domain-containing protein [Bradyrhizobium sp. Ghvi]SFO81469.1 hypothetical protein SAMN05216330_104786 [Bradyrhizobium sp. Ghvi]
MAEPVAQLETEFIFLDTEAFVREKYDWQSRSFARLKELIASSHVRILTTNITRREVSRKLIEHYGNANAAFKKYETLVNQLDGNECLNRLLDPQASERLDAQFRAFMHELRAIEVPLVIDLNSVFDDYFSRRPPFSDRKKSEFPDAVVVHAIRQWCAQNFTRAYIVSGDPDLKACCDDVLIHAETLNEIISKATVTKRIHNYLLEFVRQHGLLKQELLRVLRGRKVRVSSRFGPLYPDIDISGEVYAANALETFELNVLRRTGNQFSCEIQFAVDLGIEFALSFESGGLAYRAGYEAGKTYFESETIEFIFVVSVLVKYDHANSGFIEILAFDFDPDIEIDLRDLEFFPSLR